QIADGIRNVHIIKEVSRVHAKRQVIAIVRRVSSKHSSAMFPATASVSASARPTAKRASTGSAASRRCFFFLAKPKCLAHAQIQREPPWPRRLIDRNDSLPGLGHRVEAPIRGGHHPRVAA